MKKLILSLLAVAVLAFPGRNCLAKDDTPAATTEETAFKPVAVVSIAGYDRVMGSIAYLGKLSDNEGLDKNLEGLLKFFTQGEGLKGIDPKRPWGFVLSTDDIQFQPLVFIPVVDLSQLLKSLAPLSFVGEAKDLGNGTFELQNGAAKVYVKEQKGWAFIGQLPESLEKLPANPAKLLGGLDRQYDLAIRLHVHNVPEVWRTMFIDQVKAGMQTAAERKPDEEEEAFLRRQKLMESQIETFTARVNETDRVTIGVALDQKKNVGYLDFRMTALPDSGTAKQYANFGKMPTNFFGFLMPDAAATYHVAVKIDDKDRANMENLLTAARPQVLKELSENDKLPDDATRKVAQEIVSEMFDVVEGTLKAGKMDAGAAVSFSGTRVAAAAGIFVADPMAVERSIKKIVELAKQKEPGFPGMKFDAETHGDIRIHTMAIPVKDNKELVPLFGDNVDVAIGIGKESVYVAVGKDGISLLKKAVDKSKAKADTKVPYPTQFNIALRPVVDFVAAMSKQMHFKTEAAEEGGAAATEGGAAPAGGGDKSVPVDRMQAVLAAMSTELAKSPGKDHVRILAQPIKNGIATRIQAEEGVLRLIGMAIKMSGAAGMAPPAQ